MNPDLGEPVSRCDCRSKRGRNLCDTYAQFPNALPLQGLTQWSVFRRVGAALLVILEYFGLITTGSPQISVELFDGDTLLATYAENAGAGVFSNQPGIR